MFSFIAQGAGFALCQNDGALRTPKGKPFAVPSKSLAVAIVREFEEGGKDFRNMPLAQMALTAIDVIEDRREDVIGGILSYGDHELICQRADGPPELAREQEKLWQPYLEWCKTAFSAELITGVGIAPFKQSGPALNRLREHLEKLDPFCLAGLSEACAILSSLVLGLALMEGRAGPAEALEAAEMEALWQNKKWGEDQDFRDRYDGMRRDLDYCAKWFSFLGK